MVIASILMYLGSVGAASAEELKIGVLANRGVLESKTRWAEFGRYLNDEGGMSVTLIPLPPAKVNAAVANGEVDIIFSHSPHTVYATEKFGAEVLATLNTSAGSKFGGVILAKKGSGINRAEDLKGKRVMSLKFNSAAGAYIFQAHYLLKKGIDPQKDFASIKEGKKQDDLVLAVRAGLIDAAFVRTGLLEKMHREGKINKDDFVVVDAKSVPGFNLALTTDLYPEWCVSALPKVSSRNKAKLKTALLEMTPDMVAARRASITGFVEPVDMEGIKDALKTLKVTPYN